MEKNIRLIIRKFSTQKLPISQHLMSTSERKYPSFDNVVKDGNALDRDVIEVHRALFPLFVKNALPYDYDKEFSEAFRRFEWVQFYNEPRELYSSLIMMHGYKIFEHPDRFTLDNLKLVSMLAWAFEMVVIAILISDDIMDGQKSRWRLPCWYRNHEIGLSGIHDANVMRWAASNVVKKCFEKHKSYKNILKCFYDAQLVMAYGQLKDVMIRNTFLKSRNMNSYNFDHYKMFTKYKAYECVVNIPFLAIMSVLGIDESEYHVVEEVLTAYGYHIMISNDVYDCFGKYEHFGRACNDIPEGKLSWVIATALQYANERQRILLERNYGKPEDECQKIVKEIYKEIDIIPKYYEYKKNLLDNIQKDVEKIIDPRFSEFIRILINSTVNVEDDLTY